MLPLSIKVLIINKTLEYLFYQNKVGTGGSPAALILCVLKCVPSKYTEKDIAKSP